MTFLHLSVEIAAAVAGILALRPSRAPHQRSPAVAFVCFATAGLDVAREVLAVVVLRPERVRLLALVGGVEELRAPFAGATRALYSAVEVPGYLAGPSALVVALAVVVCLAPSGGGGPQKTSGPDRSEPSPHVRPCSLSRAALMAYATTPTAVKLALVIVLAVWITASALLAVAYPTMPPPAWQTFLERAYAAWHLVCALAAGALWATWARRRQPATPAVVATLALACAELLLVGSGPYAPWGANGVWTAGRWELARIIYTAAFTATSIVFLRGDLLPRTPGSGRGRGRH